MIVHDLEEKIMDVWGTADDLQAVLHFLDEHEILGPQQERLDHLMNMIIGIQSLHEQKSKMLFEEFEKVLKSNNFDENALEEEIERLKKTIGSLHKCSDYEIESIEAEEETDYEIGSIEGEYREGLPVNRRAV